MLLDLLSFWEKVGVRARAQPHFERVVFDKRGRVVKNISALGFAPSPLAPLPTGEGKRNSKLTADRVVIKVTHAIRLGPHAYSSRHRFGQSVVQQMFSIQRRLQISSMN